MGGNALSYTSVRMTRSNFEALTTETVRKLKALYPNNRVEPVVAYASKADFGDLDVLVESTGYNPFDAAEALGAVEVVRNGPVTSLGVKVRPELDQLDGNVFQVDLLSMPPADFAYASGYFAFNDLGNLCGRVAHKMGLRHGHDGLKMPLRDGDYLYATLKVTQDFDAALAFLDYDPVRFRQGFETLEDIFQYVVSSKYFNREIFLLENRNYKAKVRDRKRRTYMEFLKWVEGRTDVPAYPYPEDKAEWLPTLFEAFPAVEVDYRHAQRELELNRALKEKYNGEYVSKLTGLTDKTLGMLMKHFKESFESAEAMRDFVLAAPPAQVDERLLAVKAGLAL